ncbi:MAG: efflux RND transporter permease subunit [Anaerolineae bacterium]|nr:efflux RND transporter permease subunit [Anaerolineae bacterium]
MANAYALAASYMMAITIVPVLANFFISKESMPAEGTIELTESMSSGKRIWARVANVFIGGVDWLGRQYAVLIGWALRNRLLVVVFAALLLFFGLFLFGQRPVQFLPNFGEPTITVTVALPSTFPDSDEPLTIAWTDAKVSRLEEWVQEQAGVETVQATVGTAGGFGVTDGSVNETSASLSITMQDQATLDALLEPLREQAEAIFNDVDNDGQPDVDQEIGQSFVSVSGAGQAGGGFGGFSVVVQGVEGEEQPTLPDLAVYNETILSTLTDVDGLVNVELESEFVGETTYIRIDGIPALRYVAELETDDTIGVSNEAILAVQEAIDDLRGSNPSYVPVEVTQGFESEEQERGIADIFTSMAIATLIAYLLLTLTFGNPLLPIEILVSLPLAIVGAAVALTITDRVVGLPALIGLLMLVGIVLTNAIVFLDRVKANRKQGMVRNEALREAGLTRLRPILMTATTTITAQLPLAASTESGAIIAAELGTVVVGGLISSTLLTLLVLPVIYSLFDSGVGTAGRLLGFGKKTSQEASVPSAGD